MQPIVETAPAFVSAIFAHNTAPYLRAAHSKPTEHGGVHKALLQRALYCSIPPTHRRTAPIFRYTDGSLPASPKSETTLICLVVDTHILRHAERLIPAFCRFLPHPPCPTTYCVNPVSSEFRRIFTRKCTVLCRFVIPTHITAFVSTKTGRMLGGTQHRLYPARERGSGVFGTE